MSWKTQPTIKLLVLSFLVSGSSLLASKDWTYADSGRTFRALPTRTNLAGARKQCRSQGMAVLNPDYLEDAERNALVSSGLFNSISWDKGSFGKESTSVWTSTMYTSAPGGNPLSRGAFTWLLYRQGEKIGQLRTLEKISSRKPRTVCMTTTPVWYQCTGILVCHLEGGGHWDHGITESGSSKEAASLRVVERSQSSDLFINRAQCEMNGQMFCHRVF